MNVCWEEQTATNTPKCPENPSVTQRAFLDSESAESPQNEKKTLLQIVVILNPMDFSQWTCTGTAMTLKKQEFSVVPLSNLVYSTQVPEESFGSVEQGLVFRTHHDVGDVPMAPIGVQQEPLPEGQGERRDCQEILVIAHQQRRDRERLWRFLRAFTGEKTKKEKMLKYLV